MSYDRMGALEERLTAEIGALLQRAHEADAREDERFGEGQDSENIPNELKRREDRLARLREAKAALEKEARQARAAHHRELAKGCSARAEAAEAQRTSRLTRTLERKNRERAEGLDSRDGDDDEGPPFTTKAGLPKHRPRTTVDGCPHPSAQRNFTDSDSRIMESGGAFVQGYNAQIVVDEHSQVVVAGAVTNQPPDAGNLIPMLERAIENCGEAPQRLSADSGYWSAGAPPRCDARGTEVYIATERHKHWDANQQVTSGPPPTTQAPASECAGS